jgi:hypothetical protein
VTNTTTSSRGSQPKRARAQTVIINNREYEPSVKIVPPGELCPALVLLQQEDRCHASPPPPPYASTLGHFVLDLDGSSEDLDND